MIDVAAAREAYNCGDLSNVGLVAGKCNMADGIPKLKPIGAHERFVDTGADNKPVDQWVIRTPMESCLRLTTGQGGVQSRPHFCACAVALSCVTNPWRGERQEISSWPTWLDGWRSCRWCTARVPCCHQAMAAHSPVRGS